MEFGVLFTSHPNHAEEPHPHRAVHARVTEEIQLMDELGYDTAWIAEHHFSNEYGIMPDVFAYMGYLAGVTKRVRIGAAVVTLPLYDPIRVVENAAFVDILSNGRCVLGLGSGYRKYEFDGFGRPFDNRRDVQEEAIEVIQTLFHEGRIVHEGKHFAYRIDGDLEILPVSVQRPHPPLYMGAGSERSIVYAARKGFGLMQSTLPGFEAIGANAAVYRAHMPECPAPLNANPAHGHIDVARLVYVAETDAQARADSEDGVLRHLRHFMSSATSGYFGNVSEKDQDKEIGYDELAETTLLHGSPDTVARRIGELRDATGMTSLLLHNPPHYGHERTMRSLRLFAEEVIPRFRPPAGRLAAE